MDQNRMMLDALLRAIRDRCSDSVSLAIVYGSFVTGDTGPKSDLDVLFIGSDERAFELQRGFVFRGIGYDFWCMLEARMQRILAEFQPLVSIFAQGRLAYADNPERERWFASLQHRLRTANQTEPPTKYARQIDGLLDQMKALAFDHRLADDAARRHIQGRIVLLAGDMLARLNRTYFRSGIKRYLDEIATFELQPAGCVSDLDGMLRRTLATEAVHAIVISLATFWSEVQARHRCLPGRAELQGFYEEGLSTWNKVAQAAERADLPLTVLAAACLENELAGFRSQGVALTTAFAGTPSSPAGIARNTEASRAEFLHVLSAAGVQVRGFAELADVLRYIEHGE